MSDIDKKIRLLTNNTEAKQAKKLVEIAEVLVGDDPHKQMVFMLAIIAERLDFIGINV